MPRFRRNHLWLCVMAAWLPRRVEPSPYDHLLGWQCWREVFLGDHWIGQEYVGP